MSDGTVRRYCWNDGPEHVHHAIPDVECTICFVPASDYDALHTQARELATFVRANTLLTDNLNQIAQAVLKEGR